MPHFGGEDAMQQLSGIDEMFLSLDTSRTSGHIAAIGILPKTEGSTAHTVEFVRQRIAERLDTLPPLRWKLRSVPLHIDVRSWVEEEDLNLSKHIHAITLPQPGSYQQLDERMGQIMATPLERDKPMWQFYLIDGLEDERFAYVLKISHGIADGSVVWTIFDHLSDDPQLHPEAEPSPTREWGWAGRDVRPRRGRCGDPPGQGGPGTGWAGQLGRGAGQGGQGRRDPGDHRPADARGAGQAVRGPGEQAGEG